MLAINIILLIVGFIILIKGADFFVDGASSVASNFKVSKMLIGLTIVAFGTSAPEFAVSVKSLLSGSGDIVLGNVIGSNILNILLILGSSAMFHSLNVKNNTVKKELPITMLITTLFAVLLLFFSVFLYYLISMSRKKIDVDQDEKPAMSLSRSFIWTIGGIAAIVLGSNAVVDSATYLAKAMGVSERLISLTIIALGTSLPELVTSITATRKGEYDIAIGNVVGSNVFNIGIVIGLPVAILGGIEKIAFSYIDLIVMIASAILLFIFSVKDNKISKKEGLVFLLIFVVYYTYVILT